MSCYPISGAWFRGRISPAFLVFVVVAFAAPLVPVSAQARTSSPLSKSLQSSSASKPAASESPAAAASGAAPGEPTAPTPATAARLAVLPAPLPPALTQGINVVSRSAAILNHLNEVIRFYRMTAVPIQKTGEPSDVLYAEQSQSAATQAAQLAFRSARDEAALLARIAGPQPAPNPKSQAGEAQKLAVAEIHAAQQIQDLQTQQTALTQQIASAHGPALASLQQQREDVAGQLELVQAMAQAMTQVSGVSQSTSTLEQSIDQLQQSVPELVNGKIKPVASTLESIASLRDAGVSTQAVTLFQLLGTERAIGDRLNQIKTLESQATDLRSPLLKILRATLDAGQKLQSQPLPAPGAATPAASPASQLTSTKKTYDQLTDAFKTISAVSVPISQEVLVLEQSRSNLLSWRASVDEERTTIVHSLLLRVLLIAAALAIILTLGEIWRRATQRYVQDIRRRRQLLLVRRLVIGFLSGIVLLLGFVTQFSSLATFAGFITAGIAVGLQTILLSVAAYFFIVGRYGVRVGDRITVASVTGDVVEVGLVRFYMMELTGAGTELHPTGRIAVFANSVLFQTGTPLYKQIPGTDYAWHQISVKLKPATDYQPAVQAIRTAVETVYNGYKAAIEQQHAQVESWMDAALEVPAIESRLELQDGLQFTVLYPVQIAQAGATDEQIIDAILQAMTKNPAIAEAIDGQPTVRAVIK